MRPLPTLAADSKLSKSSGLKRYWTAEWVNAFGTAVIAFFTIALAIFALWAWRESKHASDIFQDQLKEAQTQTASVQSQLQEARRQTDAAQNQIEEMRKQSKAAQEQITIAREAQRPWITVQEAPPEVTAGFCFIICPLSVTLKLRNIGHAPAYSVVSYARFWVGATGSMLEASAAMEKQKATCERGEQLLTFDKPEWTERGRTLFPEQLEDRTTIASLTPKELEALKVIKKEGGIPIDPERPTILGCVQYAFDGRFHHTMFAYAIDIQPNPTEPFIIAGRITLRPIIVPQLWSAN